MSSNRKCNQTKNNLLNALFKPTHNGVETLHCHIWLMSVFEMRDGCHERARDRERERARVREVGGKLFSGHAKEEGAGPLA